MPGSKKGTMDFTDFSGGLNVADDPVAIQDNQVSQADNVLLRQKGFTRRKGWKGLSATQTFTTYIEGMFGYLQGDGTDKLIAVSGGDIYDVNKSTEVLTQRTPSLGGTGQAHATTYQDILWMCNGTEVVKLENETANLVGIAAPSGSTSSVQSGGSLAVGVYKIFVVYARKVSGNNVLYSTGEAVADVTTTGANLTVRVSGIPNSTDAQVNNKIIFMTDAGGSTYFFYGETDDNTTTTIDITSDANKNIAVVYSAVASGNIRPPAFEYIHAHDNRIWGSVGNILYYSLKGNNQYSLERYKQLNLIQYPYEIIGIFSIGVDLYVNTIGGVIKQPGGQVNAKFDITDDRWHFIDIKTAKPWGGGVIGLTNDGVRFMNGNGRFSDIDWSFFVRPEIDAVYNFNANFRPAAAIFRRNLRTEYHLSYQDTNVSSNVNNRTLVLNLSKMTDLGKGNIIAPWERRTIGSADMVVDSNNSFFAAQSINGDSHILAQEPTTTADQNFYDDSGSAFNTSATAVLMTLITKERIASIRANVILRSAYIFMQSEHKVTFTTLIRDRSGFSDARQVGATPGVAPQFNLSQFNVTIFAASEPLIRQAKIGNKMKGSVISIKFTQEEDDKALQIFDTVLDFDQEEGRMTKNT